MNANTAKELQDALDAIDYNGTLNKDLPNITKTPKYKAEISRELKQEAERMQRAEAYDKQQIAAGNPHHLRGGPGRGQGRKPVAEGQPTITVSLRMTATQRDKLALLGGAEWVRQQIEHKK